MTEFAPFSVCRMNEDSSLTLLQGFDTLDQADEACEEWSEKYPYAYIDSYTRDNLKGLDVAGIHVLYAMSETPAPMPMLLKFITPLVLIGSTAYLLIMMTAAAPYVLGLASVFGLRILWVLNHHGKH